MCRAFNLAQKLIEIAPKGLQRVFYSDSGATAVEIAMKMAVQYWQLKGDTQRIRIATLAESYHGDTVGSMSLGYSETFHRYHKSLLFPVLTNHAAPCVSLLPGHERSRCSRCGDQRRHGKTRGAWGNASGGGDGAAHAGGGGHVGAAGGVFTGVA